MYVEARLKHGTQLRRTLCCASGSPCTSLPGRSLRAARGAHGV